MLLLGFIAAAIAGSLVEYLMGSVLPDKPKYRHLPAISIAILVFAYIAIWSSSIESPASPSTPPVTEQSTNQTNPGFSDNFSSHQLQRDWVWIDPLGDSRYSMIDSSGKLRITVPGSNHDFWGDQGFNAPRLVQRIEGSFIATTKLNIDPLTFYQGAGILIQQDSDYWVNLQVGNLYGYREGYLFYKNNSPELLAGSIKFDSEVAYLRLERCDSAAIGFISIDGVNWHQIASIPFSSESLVWVGPIAQSSRQSGNLIVDFDEFALSFCP